MSTPTQPAVTIETPFGTAKITDQRFYRDHNESRPRLAYIAFDEELVVNRKAYKGVSLELQRGWNGEAYMVTPTGYNYRELSESARTKLTEWFSSPERAELYAPYLEELDPADTRRQIKSSIRHHIGSELHKTEGNRDFPEESRALVKELMTEILREALDYTKDGKSFSSFYFERD